MADQPKMAVVTGAGSGVGQATAVRLLQAGWQVALVGRRETALQETVQLAGNFASQALVQVCDITQTDAVTAMAALVLEKFGSIQVLVNAAGTNTPGRSLEKLQLANYQQILDTNLNGAYYCVSAFLSSMRQQQSGTIINIVSVAGKQASPKAGVAYVVSKFGQAGLTQAINAEERPNGIRACSIFPGDINTPILDLRPSPPPAEARQQMLQAEDVAACVLLVLDLPMRATIEEIVITPTRS